MIIDFHTHTFPDRLAPKAVGKLMKSADIVSYSDGTNGCLLKSMEKAGIALSVVLPVVTNPAQEPSMRLVYLYPAPADGAAAAIWTSGRLVMIVRTALIR